MKDYYQILGVGRDSGPDEIRRRYRLLAMQYHPDRNPDRPEAAEKFKEIAEAYGVLTDPAKRRAYDACGGDAGRYRQGSPGGFRYSQEDILRDLFQDPQFQQMFEGLLREFQRSGYRATPQFIRQSFFGGRGGTLFGGLFLLSKLAGPVLLRSTGKALPGRRSLLRTVGDAVGSLLGRSGPKTADPPPSSPDRQDVTYFTPLTAAELKQGKLIQVVTKGPDGQEMLRVTIPPGSRSGQKLRLRGKGLPGPRGRGDLFLLLEESKS